MPRPIVALHTGIFVLSMLAAMLLPSGAMAQGSPDPAGVAPRYTAPDGRFSSDVPSWDDYMTVSSQNPMDGVAESYVVIWQDGEGGRLARIDLRKQESLPANAAELKQRIDEELASTAQLYGFPAKAKLLETEFLPTLFGGAGYLSAFVTEGSNMISEYEDGTKRRPDATRTALLFFRSGYLLRVTFLATAWQGNVPGKDGLDYIRAKTVDFADSIVFAALPEFSGESQANWQLKADVYPMVSMMFRASHACAVQSISTSVTRADGSGRPGSEELWVARGCNKEGRYKIALTPSAAGGIDFDVSEAAAGPTGQRNDRGSMALTCILNQTAAARRFQFRWGETADWTDTEVSPDHYLPMVFSLSEGDTSPDSKLLIRLGPHPDPEFWPVFELESRIATAAECATQARIYTFTEIDGQFLLSEPE